MHKIEYVSLDALKPNPRNARTHSTKQICQIADNIGAVGFTVPVLVDENRVILAPGMAGLRPRNFSGSGKYPLSGCAA